MKILAMFHPRNGASTADFIPHQHDELRRSWQLYSEGVVREMFMRGDGRGVIATMEAQDLDEARAALDSLPLVRLGMLGYDLIPLNPFVGFQVLFAPAEMVPERTT